MGSVVPIFCWSAAIWGNLVVGEGVAAVTGFMTAALDDLQGSTHLWGSGGGPCECH